MKKLKEIRIKEFQRTILLVDIILYLLIIFFGYTLIYELNESNNELLIFNETIYFVLAFIYLLAYVVNRRKNNYEYLIQAFICVYTSFYLCLNENTTNIEAVLGTALLIFTVSYMINKIYNGKRLYKNKDVNFIQKMSIGIVLGTFGIYMSQLIYKTSSITNYVIGYYLIIFGLLSLLEPLFEFLLRDPLISNKAYMLLKYDTNKKEEKKPIKKIRENKIKRISKKSSE